MQRITITIDDDLLETIDTISAQETVNRCFEGNQDYCAKITDDPIRSQPNNPYKLIAIQPFNYVRRRVEGIDFDAAYRIRLAGADSILVKGTTTRCPFCKVLLGPVSTTSPMNSWPRMSPDFMPGITPS